MPETGAEKLFFKNVLRAWGHPAVLFGRATALGKHLVQ